MLRLTCALLRENKQTHNILFRKQRNIWFISTLCLISCEFICSLTSCQPSSLLFISAFVCVCILQEHSLSEEHHPLESDLCLHPEERHLVHRPVNHESLGYREQPGDHTPSHCWLCACRDSNHWDKAYITVLFLRCGAGWWRQRIITSMWPTSSGCSVKAVICTQPSSSPTPLTNSGSGCSSASAGVSSPVHLSVLSAHLSTCLCCQLTWTPVCLITGIPFPIIMAWAFGKLYYDNEKWVT